MDTVRYKLLCLLFSGELAVLIWKYILKYIWFATLIFIFSFSLYIFSNFYRVMFTFLQTIQTVQYWRESFNCKKCILTLVSIEKGSRRLFKMLIMIFQLSKRFFFKIQIMDPKWVLCPTLFFTVLKKKIDYWGPSRWLGPIFHLAPWQ